MIRARIPSLLTWDIDGTLLRTIDQFANKAHDNAINEAVYAVHGATITVKEVHHASSTDLSIIRRMCTAANIPAPQIDSQMKNVFRHAEQVVKIHSDMSHLVLPGVLHVLSVLSDRKIPCALTTGNMAYIADLKLKSAGLRSFFVGGAFGDEREDRSDILKLAVERCAPGVSMEEVVHIGDAVSDIQAAKRNGARSIAVATGAYERKALEAENPDFIFDDLSDTGRFLKVIGLD